MEEARGKNFTVYDFRKGEIFFYPYAGGIRFTFFEKDVLKITFFFSKAAIEKMLWFNNFFNSQGGVALVAIDDFNQYEERDKAEGKLIMNIPDFPVEKYALSFGPETILQKGLETMKVSIISSFDIEISNGYRFSQFFKNDCIVNFNCVEGNLVNSIYIDQSDILEVPARVISPSLV